MVILPSQDLGPVGHLPLEPLKFLLQDPPALLGEEVALPVLLLGGQADQPLLFHGLAVETGMPTLAAVLNGAPILGLSGNPFAMAVAFELLFPVLLGRGICRGRAVLDGSFSKPSPQRRFLGGRVEQGRVTLRTTQENRQIRAMVGCNCLVELAAGSPPPAPGADVTVVFLAAQ